MARQGLALAGGVIGGYFGGPQGAQIGFAIGGTLGGMIDPQKVQGPKLGEIPMQTGRDGVPIPVGWGLCHTAGNILQKNTIQEVEKEEGGGKGGGPVVVNTYYYRTFAIGLMRSIEGPIAGVLRIWENDKLVYDTRDTPAIPVEETQAFADGIRIYLGDEAQTPDPDLEAEWGVGTTPYYRGLPYITFVDKDVTDFAGAIPQYRFEIQTALDLSVTSRPYPVEQVDGLTSIFTKDKIRQFDMPIEGFDATASLNSISLEAPLVEYTAELEGWDNTDTLVSITLDPLQIEYSAELEGWNNTDSLNQITITPLLIEYRYENEGWDVTSTLRSIIFS
jgi:hypothetical protein